jgi:hypothetical protein
MHAVGSYTSRSYREWGEGEMWSKRKRERGSETERVMGNTREGGG